MGYISTGMGYCFGALLVFLMALRLGTETLFGVNKFRIESMGS